MLGISLEDLNAGRIPKIDKGKTRRMAGDVRKYFAELNAAAQDRRQRIRQENDNERKRQRDRAAQVHSARAASSKTGGGEH